ncbi:putative acetyltransferase [Bacillus sp. TS-2]|nr:putative acetyltransferase [Bacillus sp. TS-2]
MDILLKKLDMQDEESLLEFEKRNRTYFEKFVPSRGNDYYLKNEFNERHKQLLLEQEKDESLFFLIQKRDGTIIGRINVIDIQEHIGEIGYRIGEEFVGGKVASQAVSLLCQQLSDPPFTNMLHSLKAKTLVEHIASQRVLEKNHFKKIATEEVTVNNQSLNFYIYEYQLL